MVRNSKTTIAVKDRGSLIKGSLGSLRVFSGVLTWRLVGTQKQGL